MHQSTIPCLKRIWPYSCYTENKQESILKLYDGRTVYLRTGTDPNSAEGIQRCSGVWLDEAGMCSKLFWENLEIRTSFMQAPIILTSTPYAMNWLKKDIIDQSTAPNRQDICYVRWRSIDNPAFPLAEYERQKSILDPRTFRRKYEGVHEKMEGLVYEDFDTGNLCSPFPVPPNTRIFAGVDWGYNHAFAVTIRAITTDKRHFTISEFKRSGLDPNEKVTVAKTLMQTYGIEMFYCGVDRPEMISMFNSAGVPSRGFYVDEDTRYKQVIPGIEAHTALIKSKRYQVFHGKCPHLEDEYSAYSWPEHSDDKPVKEIPIPINDDLLSAERYVTVGTLHLSQENVKVLSNRKGKGLRWDDFDPSKSISKGWDSY